MLKYFSEHILMKLFCWTRFLRHQIVTNQLVLTVLIPQVTTIMMSGYYLVILTRICTLNQIMK